ncbi:hypothetical protein CPC08DRAFT_124282 [Agrocybe pediades]|nr:hypothetical protein CPC08DRAFT_124282 [Agrocybe pediades]
MSSLPVPSDNQTGRSSSAETSSHNNASQVVRYDASVDQAVEHANRTIQGQHREVGSGAEYSIERMILTYMVEASCQPQEISTSIIMCRRLVALLLEVA